MPPTIIFGDIKSLSDLSALKTLLQSHNITRFDTAAVYGGGESETRLGDAQIGTDFLIDSKIAYRDAGDATLTPEAIDASSATSLRKLKVEKVNVLYCHGPDFQTPVAEQARGFDEVKARFEHLGLSNFLPDMVQEWLRVSKDQGYVKPAWYQGMYNLFCRTYEDELFPLLRKEGMHFAAFSPLAGGFLNGNMLPNGERKGTRFVKSTQYQLFYDRPCMHEGFRKLEMISSRTGIATDELSMRWLVHHSQLNDGDAIILGASKLEQITVAVENMRKGPLDGSVAKELDALWQDPELQKASQENVDPKFC